MLCKSQAYCADCIKSSTVDVTLSLAFYCNVQHGSDDICSDHDDWSKEMVDSNVLTSIDNNTLLGGPIDSTSIMCYSLPAEIMKDGKAVPGGPDINDADRGFATSIYPPRTAAEVHPCWPKVPAKRMSEVMVH